MNTVEKGNDFERRSYQAICDAIENDIFAISPKYAKVFLKKGYHSDTRKKDIIFDLSIEIWPPNSTRFSVLYLIECKDYSTKNVPVGDVEEFLYKIREINYLHENDAKGVKGVFISNSSFQEGGVEIAKKTGLMLIENNTNNEMSVILHKQDRNEIQDETYETQKEVETFLYNVFDLTKIQGLKKYSRKDIEGIANKLINEIDEKILTSVRQIPLERIVNHLAAKNNVLFDFTSHIEIEGKKNISGYYDSKDNKIVIDKNIYGTDRFAFLLAHEIGHSILHKDLKLNQQVYNDFSDSEYDFYTDKHLLSNYKHWIEWQANEFASNLIIPNTTIFYQLVFIQKKLGINRTGHIYLDDQPVNRKDFGDIMSYLTGFFNTTATTINYKLKSLGLITYDRKKDDYQNELRKFYNDLTIIK